MGNKISLIGANNELSLYSELANGVCVVFQKDKNEIFNTDRYNLKNKTITSREIFLKPEVYRDTFVQALAIYHKYNNSKLSLKFSGRRPLGKD